MIELTHRRAFSRTALLALALRRRRPCRAAARPRAGRQGRAPAKTEADRDHGAPDRPFRARRPDVKRFGDLEFRGGLVLTSPSKHFGGWSGLDRGRGRQGSLFAVSDAGAWLSADIKYDGTRPSGLTDARLGADPVDRRPSAGATSASGMPKSWRWSRAPRRAAPSLIGFERQHRIGRFEIRDRELQAPTGLHEDAAPKPGA